MIEVRKDYIFPTSITCIDNILELDVIDNINSHIKESSVLNEEKRITNWQSGKNPNLHTHIKYKKLTDMVLHFSKVYLDDMSFEYEQHYVSGMWSNILKPGETHSPHTHANNIVSGVYYTRAEDNSPAITFLDPRPQAKVLQPEAKEHNKLNSSMWYYPAKTNRLLLFPSWLQHYVPVNKSNKDRYSIAFNVMIKGQVGRPEHFQSAKF
jgi:uncharacterized protein (TIGR02466 family)